MSWWKVVIEVDDEKLQEDYGEAEVDAVTVTNFLTDASAITSVDDVTELEDGS